MNYWIYIGVLVLGYVVNSSAQPPCVCDKELEPVCGTDGVTYNNECLLDCARSRNQPRLAVEKRGVCDIPSSNSLCICTLEYMPLCASDGDSYPNNCVFECKARTVNIQKVHDGVCKENRDTDKAGKPEYCECTEELEPVCGTDGTTYNNLCLLNCAKKSNKNLEKGYDGKCLPVLEYIGLPPCTCTRNLNPVCGSDGVTYPNECVMKCTGSHLSVTRHGSCDGLIQTVVVDDGPPKKM